MEAKPCETSADGDRIVTLNVSGVKFQARASLFTAYPSTLLGAMLLSETADRSKSDFFFDANPRAFENVMDMYRRGTLRCPADMDIEVFQGELDFWQIPSGDSVNSLLNIDAKLFHEATMANTRNLETKLLHAGEVSAAPKARKQEHTGEGKMADSIPETTANEQPVDQSTPSEVSRVLDLVDGLSEDLDAQLARLQGNKRILSSVRRALDQRFVGLYEYKCGEPWRLLQSATEEKSIKDGHSMDEILTSVKEEGCRPLTKAHLSGDDLVLFDWWSGTVGAKNLKMFWMPFFVRPDRKRVYVDYTFYVHLKSKKQLYDMLDVRFHKFAEEDERAPETFTLGRMAVDFDTITRHGVEADFAVEQEDVMNGGYFTLVRYDVPMLRISWDPSGGPSLEERLLALIRGELDPSPHVTVFQSARGLRSVHVTAPKPRGEAAQAVAAASAAVSRADSDGPDSD